MPPNPDPATGGEAGATSSGVDESLYSRQLYVMGHEAQVCLHFMCGQRCGLLPPHVPAGVLSCLVMGHQW